MRSNWYWLFEFGGNAIGLAAIGFSAILLGSIATAGSIKFIENNPLILWGEIGLLVVAGVIIAKNLVYDIIKFSKEK